MPLTVLLIIPNPQSSRYYWAPTGYGLTKGELWYQNIWIMHDQISYGLSVYFSCGVGMAPLFLFSGTASPVWLVPKFSTPGVKN